MIQAGPCPVVAVSTGDSHGYDAVQLAFEAVAATKISKPEIGHLRRPTSSPHRHLHEFRGSFELAAGDTVTVRRFEPGDAIKVIGRSKGKGFAGTIKRHNFASRPDVARLAQRARPGLDRPVRPPSRVIKGVRMSGHMGDETRHPARPAGARRRPERNLLLVTGAVPGPTGGIVFVRGGHLMAGLTAPSSAATASRRRCVDEMFGLRAEPAAAARGRQGRGRRAPPGHALGQDARPGSRRRRQAVPPEGHRPRPPGHDPRAAVHAAAASSSGPTPRSYAVKVNRKAARKARAIGALAARARRLDRRLRRQHVHGAEDEGRRSRCSPIGATARPLVVCVSLGEADAGAVVPQPPQGRRRRAERARGHRPPVGAQPARLAGRARAAVAGAMPSRGDAS